MNRTRQRHRQMLRVASKLKGMQTRSPKRDSVVYAAGTSQSHKRLRASPHSRLCQCVWSHADTLDWGEGNIHISHKVQPCVRRGFKSSRMRCRQRKKRSGQNWTPVDFQPGVPARVHLKTSLRKHNPQKKKKCTYIFTRSICGGNLSVRLNIESGSETGCSTKDEERLLASPWWTSTFSVRVGNRRLQGGLTHLCWAFVSTYVGLVTLSRIIMVLTGARTLQGTPLERGCKSLEKWKASFRLAATDEEGNRFETKEKKSKSTEWHRWHHIAKSNCGNWLF